MKRYVSLLLLLAALHHTPVFAAEPPAGQARGAEAVLADIATLKLNRPQIERDRATDEAYIRERQEIIRQYSRKLITLERELYEVSPNHAGISEYLGDRWTMLTMGFRDFATVLKETEEYLSAHPKGPAADKARVMRGKVGVLTATSADERSRVIHDFQSINKDPASMLDLLSFVHAFSRTPEERTMYAERIIKEFPDSKMAKMAAKEAQLNAAVGKSFTLKFKDAVSGKQIDTENLKGKVLVIDFWATWCGPCKAEMPKMKKIYAEFKDKGVEFIGVSLDKADGLQSLRYYVAANDIAWPQYFQNDDGFAEKWGVLAIPTVFVVDTEGKLVTAKGRGELEKLLPELLAKKSRAAIQ